MNLRGSLALIKKFKHVFLLLSLCARNAPVFSFCFFFLNIEIGLNSMLFKQQIGMLIKGQTSQPHKKQLPTKVFTFHFKHGASDLVRQNLCELHPLKETPANSLSKKGKVTNVSSDSLTFLLQSLIFDRYG